MISIITATFNAEKTIHDNLASLAKQTVKPEHIVIDGGSWDNTLEQINRKRLEKSCIISEKDDGIYDAMNKGLSRVSGDIVGILNADDFYSSPTVLEMVCSTFADKSIDACYGDLCYVDAADKNKVIRYWKSGSYNYKKFYMGWMPPHPTFFVRKSVYEKFGTFNLDLGSAADYELMLRFLVKHRIKAAYIPEILVMMRTGGMSNATIRNRLAANKNDRKAWAVNGLKPYPWTLICKPLRKILQWIRKPSDLP